jgi:hypothetical protein
MDKPLEQMGEVLTLNWSHKKGGWNCRSFPRYIDIWMPEDFLKHSCVKQEGDDLVITTNQGVARYRVVKVVDAKWWIAELVELCLPS